MITLKLKSISVLSVLVVALLLAGGCKEDSTTEPQQNPAPTIVSFSADPVTVPAGGDSVTLNWQVNDATSLSISPGIGSVTPADSGSIKVFVSATTTFTLTASNSVGDVTATTQVNAASSMTVNGYVKDIDGEPISGITVQIKGKTPTTTAADGSFTIPDVVPPYEIRIILSTQQAAVVYQGLTRPDPSLLYIISTTTGKSASISGFVPPAPGKTTMVYFVSGTRSWRTIADPATGFYNFGAYWVGSATSYTGNLSVLRWTQNTSGLPSQYDGYGSRNLTISDGGSFDNNNFLETDLSDPAELNINGSIVVPPGGYIITYKQLFINFGNAYVFIGGEYSGTGLTDNFSYTVPSITGATFEVDAIATVPASPNSRGSVYQKKGITGGSSGVTLTLSAAPQLSLPVHNGIGIDTTTQFLWTQGGGTGINLARISPDMGNPGPVYYIFTSANSTTIPNLSPQGMGLPASTNYTWYVLRYYPMTSIDAAASDSFVPLINGHAGDNGRLYSETFYFTTHP